jgi:hypothetical protein
VPMNSPAIGAFRKAVCRLWQKVLKRRSQKRAHSQKVGLK